MYLIGKPIAEVGVVIPLAEVKAGDVVLFTIGSGDFERVTDADTVVKVKPGEAYFEGGTYLAEAAGSGQVFIAKAAA